MIMQDIHQYSPYPIAIYAWKSNSLKFSVTRILCYTVAIYIELYS